MGLGSTMGLGSNMNMGSTMGMGLTKGRASDFGYGRMGCTLARWSTIARVSTMARGPPSLGCLDCCMILVSVAYVCPHLAQRLLNKKEKKKKRSLIDRCLRRR